MFPLQLYIISITGWFNRTLTIVVLFGVTVPKHYLTNYRVLAMLLLILVDADANQLLTELGWDNLETQCQKLKVEMVYKSLNGLAPN